MKTTTLSSICLSLLAVCILLLLSQPFSIQAQPPANMPGFTFSNVSGGHFGKSNLKQNTATVIILFSPDCEHCQQQAQWITKDAAKLKNVQLVWVSFHDNAEDIKAFGNKYLPGVKLPMVFLQDQNFDFDTFFGESNVPTILVYDSKGKFVKDFREETSVDKLTAFIR